MTAIGFAVCSPGAAPGLLFMFPARAVAPGYEKVCIKLLNWGCRDSENILNESGGQAEDGMDWGVLRVDAAVQDSYDTIVSILLRPEAVNPVQAWARDEL